MGRSKNSRDIFDYVGFNSRLDTINALFLNTLLEKHLDGWILARQKNASVYNDQLKSVQEITTPSVEKDATHVYHLYQLKCCNKTIRDDLKQFLRKQDISTGIYYPIPCHEQKSYENKNDSNLFTAEGLSETLLALPMHPYLAEEEIKYVCDNIKHFFINH